MESILQSLAILVASVAVLLFFGPIIVIISIIGDIKLGPLKVKLSDSKIVTRLGIAVIGLGIWLLIYIPLVWLARQAIDSSIIPVQSTPISSPQPTVTVFLTPDFPQVATVEILESPVPTPFEDVYLPEMVLIPQGVFPMGTSYTADFDFDPVHDVFVSDFYIDKYEVTNAEYHNCVEAKVCSAPSSKRSNTRDSYYEDSVQFGNHPVVFVTWADAQNFCTWRNARLPTEAEWEKAARWNPVNESTTLFPWGDEEPDHSRANFLSIDTTSVDSFPDGQSHMGIFNMAGNVLEWVSDYYSPTYYEDSPDRDPSGPFLTTGSRVARGGAWSDDELPELWGFSRFHFDENTSRNDLGFRCANDAG